MRILLDECIDRRFAREFPEHDVRTVAQMNWKGARNGELLAKAQEAGFEVFVTVDRNLAFQQDFAGLELAVFILRAPSNRLQDLVALAPKLGRALSDVKSGQLQFVSA